MDPRDMVHLPWPALLLADDGRISGSPAAEKLLGFAARDRWGLEQRIDVALPSGALAGEAELPWRRRDVPFDEYQIWRDRLLGRWQALRVRTAFLTCGLLLVLEPDTRPMPPTERAERALGAIQHSLVTGRSEVSLRGLLRMLVELACELTGARYGALGVLAPDASRLRDFVYVGMPEEVARHIGHLPEGRGLLGAVIREGRTLRVNQIAADPRSSGWPAHHPPMSSFLGVPLRIGDRIFGNFYVTEKQGAPSFTEEDARHLERFSEQAALAVAFVEHVEDEQRRLFRTLVEHAPYGLVFFPAAEGEPYGNLAAERMLGDVGLASGPQREYELRQSDGSPFPADEAPERRARLGQTFLNLEVLVVRHGGQPIAGLLSAAPVRSEDGAFLGSVVVYQDITTLKELERLRQDFAAMVAHDMRTPVQSVLLQIEVLIRRTTGDAAWVPLATLQNMRRSGEHLSRLISDLLEASHLEAHRLRLDRQVFDVQGELRSLLLRLRPTLSDREVVVEAHDAPAAFADQMRFDQILTNLLENAAKYSREHAPIRITLSAERGGALIEIRDEGQGIAPEELPHLFDRYFRGRAMGGRRGGVGLGLYIARGFAQAHGGTLTATSLPGVGSTFELWLPGPPQPAPSEAHVT